MTNEMYKRASLLGPATCDSEQKLLNLEYFFSVMKIVQEYTIKHIALSIDQHKENRRKLLKIDDEEDYEWEILR